MLEIRTISQWYGTRIFAYLNEATICSSSRSIFDLTNDECDLHLQEHPIVDKLHLDDVLSFEYGIHDLVRIGHGFLGTFSFCISSSIG